MRSVHPCARGEQNASKVYVSVAGMNVSGVLSAHKIVGKSAEERQDSVLSDGALCVIYVVGVSR